MLWSAGAAGPADVILASCDALVAGLDSPLLRDLAGLPFGSLADDVHRLLPGALDQLGIKHFTPGSDEAQVAAAVVRARQCAAGELSVRDFTAWAHATFRHGENEMLEPLLRLEDEYDIMLYTGKSEKQLDQEVRDVIATLIALPGPGSA